MRKNISAAEFATILTNVSNSNTKIKGKAQCDLAQLIWSGKLDSSEIERLLRSDDLHIRVAVAWAITDLNGPPESVKWLMQKGVQDTNDGVRWLAIKCAYEMPEMRKLVSQKDIRTLREDESERVRKLALTVWPDVLSTDTNHSADQNGESTRTTD